ncbi:hypothetical protein KAR91_28055 [Candidatus Pacearchaeota archaeon]|nr:hypothetical protein [Candidatus Pacearchaeota archaeon]
MRKKELEEQNKELKEALEGLVDMYIANRGTPDSEFISCITPRSASEMTPLERIKDRTWSTWDKARILIGD